MLPFEDVTQRFERTTTFRFYGIGFAGVVEQRVDRFLQHPLFVAQDDLRGFDFQQTFQTVVADDHPAVQVVQIGAGKTTTIQWHQGAQFWWNNGQVLDHGPFGAVFHPGLSIAESFHYAQALEGF